MIRAHGGRAECCFNWNIYEISVNFFFFFFFYVKAFQKLDRV